MGTALVLLRRHLRLEDNSALHAACSAYEHVLPVHIHASETEAPWQPGAASQWQLHHSLQAFGIALAKQGGPLFAARGDSLCVRCALVRQCETTALYWNRHYEPVAMASLLLKSWRDADEGVASGYPASVADAKGTRHRALTAWQALQDNES